MRFIDAAMPMLQLGFAVFPLSPGSKLPAIAKKDGGQGVLDASKDPDQIREWARRFPKANVGIACGRASGVTVLDLDPKNGSAETIAAFRARKQLLVPTVCARTPSGGWHLYYAYEPVLTNSKSQLGKGIDVRTSGGYVVAPPSRLDDGRFYSWVNAPLGGDVPRMPRWAFERLKPKENAIFAAPQSIRSVTGALAGLTNFVRNAKAGERNQSLYWAMCRAADAGYVDESTQAMLAAAAADVGIDRKEAMKTIGSAVKTRRRLR